MKMGLICVHTGPCLLLCLVCPPASSSVETELQSPAVTGSRAHLGLSGPLKPLTMALGAVSATRATPSSPGTGWSPRSLPRGLLPALTHLRPPAPAGNFATPFRIHSSSRNLASLEAALRVSSPSFYPASWASAPKGLNPVKHTRGLHPEPLWAALEGACDLNIPFCWQCGA